MPFIKGQSLNFIVWNKGRKWDEKTREKMSQSALDRFKNKESHPRWKGDNVKYRGLHMWVQSILGKPRLCENCGSTEKSPRSYHWANISGRYNRLITDWRRLCGKCHKDYDSRVK